MRDARITIVAITALGCASADITTGSASRDSAGIQIVVNSAPRWTNSEQLTLSSTPALVIGTQNGVPYQLSKVRGGFRLSYGRVVIADGASSQLRFYDSLGQHLYSAGRRGQGPEEFRSLHNLFIIRGDTLIAGAWENLLVLTNTGAFIRAVDLKRSWVPLPPGGFGVENWFGSERAVVANTKFDLPKQPLGTRGEYSITFALSDPDSASSRLIGTFTHSSTIVTKQGNTLEPKRPWFSPIIVAAGGDSLLYIGYGNEYSVRVYTSRGELARIIRRQWTPAITTPDDVERRVARMRQSWSNADAALLKQWEYWLRMEPVTDTIALFSQFIADDVGRLWVRDANPIDETVTEYLGGMPQEGSRWSVFDEKGQWLGNVNMPKLFHPKQIGADFVLGIELRDDSLETIAVYSLKRGPME